MALGTISALVAIAAIPSQAATYNYSITTLAGSAGQAGTADGSGSNAQFNQPLGIALAPDGSYYISDFGNSTIRRMTANGDVTTVFGVAGNPGTNDSKGTDAQFNGPAGMVFDTTGDVLWISDFSNNVIRQVVFSLKSNTLVGLVGTYTGSPGVAGYQDGLLSVAQFNGPLGMVKDSSQNLYVADRNNHVIRMIGTNGQVSTIAGVAGVIGSTDGGLGDNLFNLPSALAFDASGNLYVADSGNFTIRKIATNGLVTTVAGTAGVSGGADGLGTNATFGVINGIALDSLGYIYVTDSSNTVRRISTAKQVVTLAGLAGVSGSADGAGKNALFNNPVGIYVASSGNGYVVDQGNNTVRKAALYELPTIVSQPQSQTVTSGVSVVFTVKATGDKPLIYQWIKDGVAISSANSSSYTLSNVQVSNAANYTVIVANAGGSVTSSVATLFVNASAPQINSSSSFTGKQGTAMSFKLSITGTKPYVVSAKGLPDGLLFDSTNFIISGIPTSSGYFNTYILASNIVGVSTQWLACTIISSIPKITSPTTLACTENTTPSYQITGSDSPTKFWTAGLPAGLTVDPSTGLFYGLANYCGKWTCTLYAQNKWGIGSTNLTLNVSESSVTSMSFDGSVATAYAAPYSMDFKFKLLDNNGNALIRPVGDFTIKAYEGTISSIVQVSNSVVGVSLTTNSGRSFQGGLVLDYSYGMEFGVNDSNKDGYSDAFDSMQTIAKDFVGVMPDNTPFSVVEFHTDEFDPANIFGSGVVSNRWVLNAAIDGILTNFVKQHYGGSRLFDAITNALIQFPDDSSSPQRIMVVISDGNDTSSYLIGDAAISTIKSLASSANVVIYTVGLGSSINVSVLTSIAQAAGGQYFPYSSRAALINQLAIFPKNVGGAYELRWTTQSRSSDAVIEPSFTLSLSSGATVSFNASAQPKLISQSVVTYSPDPPADVTSGTTNYFWQFSPHLVEYTNVSYSTTNSGSTNTIKVLDPSPSVPYFFVKDYIGDANAGFLTLASDPNVQPIVVVLNSLFAPRNARQVSLLVRPNAPCTVELMSTNTGEILQGWTLSQTSDSVGDLFLVASSSNTNDIATSIPAGAVGPIMKFVFSDLTNASLAFGYFGVDNSVYTNNPPIGQSFTLTNISGFMNNYTVTPHATSIPWLVDNNLVAANKTGDLKALTAAELADTDNDGVPNWIEYKAGTDPKNAASVFKIAAVNYYPAFDWNVVSFSTVSNHVYRIDATADLTNWITLADNIVGSGTAATNGISTYFDTRSRSNWPTQFYRVFEH